MAVGAADVRRNPVAVGDRGGLELIRFVIVVALTRAQVTGDGGAVGELLKLHVRVGLRAIDVVVVAWLGLRVVVVGRLGIDGDFGRDVARLRLHVRVDLLGIDLGVVGRRCSRLDFVDVIGS